MSHDHHGGFHGPKCWLMTAIVGVVLGVVLGFVFPATFGEHPGGQEQAQNPLGPSQAKANGFGHQPATDVHADPHGENQPGTDGQGTTQGGPGDGSSQAGERAEPAHAGDGESDAHDDGHGESHGDHGPAPTIPVWLVVPFALLLASIATMPFINAHFWHKHFPDFAFLLGSLIVAYYLTAFGTGDYSHGMSYGLYQVMHTGLEYYSFIALVGGLYVVSGGILIDLKGKGGPGLNCAILALGAVLANIVGTTGASMLLIRPFMRVNQGRLKPLHIVYFIFIVSNCAGCLTPIGDPPLYLGFLKGVPFAWTLQHLWMDWAFVVAILLGMFAFYDKRVGAAEGVTTEAGARTSLNVRGTIGIFGLVLMIVGVFIDPMLKQFAGIEGIPVGATFQIAVAAACYKLAPKDILSANEFNFFPVKEVGLLFVGIFATMIPALGYLATHGKELGLSGPAQFYYGTGALSAFLDNAPTYLNFLQIAFGNPDLNPSAVAGDASISAQTVHTFLYEESGADRHLGALILSAISTGAVFFGAMTYIGNGPNFMVKSIADASGLKMPSFFGYLARAVALLLPVLMLHHIVFFMLIG